MSNRVSRCSLALGAIAALLLVSYSARAATIQSTFDTDIEGWTVRNNEPGGGASHGSTGGNPGGYMHIVDIQAFIGFTAVAPAKFQGDLTGFDGGSFSFDTNYFLGTDTPGRTDFGTVTISGPGGSASLDFILSENPPMNQWETHMAPLTATAWGVSQASWTNILSNVTDLSIVLELFFGDDTVGLDNVRLSMASTALDHFLCYKAKPVKGSEKFLPRTVSLADQFDTTARDFDVKKPLSLCTPADKNGEGINDPDTHLKGYQIKLTKTDPKQAPDVKHAVRVTNQFGELLLDTLKPDRLLVPTAKSLTAPVDLPGTNNVDHYKCYKVKIRKKTPKFNVIHGVSVSDQFIQMPPKLFDLKKPTQLCTPVDKNGEGMKDPAAHLVCYQAKAVKGQPRHRPVSPIFVNNQFGPKILKTVKEEDLCVPSEKTVLGTDVGGTQLEDR